jgi:hypothetical protein
MGAEREEREAADSDHHSQRVNKGASARLGR